MATGIPLSYGGLVKHLFKVNRFSQVKMGLKNMQDMIRILQLPIEQLPVVHVAGTNGKGSVCWKVATALSAAGYKTGLFVSPHVSCFRERVRIDTVPITQEEVTTILTRLFHAAKENEVPVTFFEHVTLMALIHFLQQKVDVAVLEVGLGGRLDATNVVHPLLSVITSIGFDHMYVLGNTIESIALEKAGIMNSGVPVVIGPDTPVPVMLQAAKDKGAMPILVPPLEKRPSSPSSSSTSPPPDDSTLQAEVGSSKDYMAENNAIARVAMMELQRLGYNLNETSMEEGLKARPPCRFERFSLSFSTTKKPFTATSLFPVEAAVVSKVVEEAVAETKDEAKEETKEGERTIELVLDAGHNPAGLQSLGYLLQATYPPQNYRYHFVIALSSDKDPRKALSALFQVVAPPSSPTTSSSPPASSVASILFAESPTKRALPAETLKEALAEVRPDLEPLVCTVTESLPATLPQLFCTDPASDEEDVPAPTVCASLQLAANRALTSHGPEEKHVIVVCGSLYAMPLAREAIGIKEMRDSVELVE